MESIIISLSLVDKVPLAKLVNLIKMI
jgi:hypothetical protein